MLTAEEVTAAAEILRASGRLGPSARFAHLRLCEPSKDTVRAFAPGAPLDREVEAVVVPGPGLDLVEAVVSVGERRIREWREVHGMRPALLFEEAFGAILAVKADARWQDAMRARGITDFDLVQIDPWPPGSFGVPVEEGRRLTRCLSYVRADRTDNGYARPVEGVLAFVDLGTGTVIDVVDEGVVPLPPNRGSYYPDDVGPLRTDLRPLEIHQPEGPSFTVEGNLVRWQRWSFRVTLDPYEGLVLHTVEYDDAGRARSVIHRASVSEMVVPYGDPGSMHGWKNAFDAGEWGLGRMTNSLKLGCDCLGEIHYFDAVLATEQGEPWVIEHAICMHEEDYGILWKHVDGHSGASEVRRSRRLVVSNIATVGNYEYGFYWYFYLDGNIQLEVKLSGIVSPMAIPPGTEPEFGNVVAPGLAAPHHQHLFNVRLDVDLDGTVNSVYEVEAQTVPPGPDNPWKNAFRQTSRLLGNELEARREVNAATTRYWKVVNPDVRNGLGQPVGYKLIPTMSTPTMLAHPDSSVGRRAGFARHNLWVTPYRAEERRGAGDYPNQHAGGDGLPRWTAADRPIAATDVVLWYTFGVTHFVRPEDWPVMPVEYTGFLLSPVGFFDRNPALDVPPPSSACHT
jgi:primary-amine oxidase